MIVAMENGEPKKNFAGLRVLSLESRRGAEMAKLIASHGGEALIAQIDNPRGVHRPGVAAPLTAGDHPMYATEGNVRQWTE